MVQIYLLNKKLANKLQDVYWDEMMYNTKNKILRGRKCLSTEKLERSREC